MPAVARKYAKLRRKPKRALTASKAAKGAVVAGKTLIRVLRARRYVRLAEEANIKEPSRIIERFCAEHPNYGEILIRDERLREAHSLISKLADPEKKALAALLIKYGPEIFDNPALLYRFLRGAKKRIDKIFVIVESYRNLGHAPSNLLTDVLYIMRYGKT
ncbi:MAG: hypothetical protein DRO07_00495 [Candidatus Iainarchaeum archaeon]|uniref:Uncharacterized protein n=1 Tax=Candidatus Iainarchaeum sp. TaxID=3101447 RepID=A0A497JK01_9ARCH|nr:MAG: hypothetical protein DRO07_00495 [Candidatus Diapherotrites archaeon]